MSYYFAKRNALNINDCVSLTAGIAQIMTDVFSKLIVVRSFRAEKHEVKLIDKHLLDEEVKYKKTQFRTEGNTLIQNVILSLMNGGLILYAITMFRNGSLEAGDILFIVSILLLVGNTLSGVGERLLAFFEYRDRMKSAWQGIINMLHAECYSLRHIQTHLPETNPLNIVELKNGVFARDNGKLSNPINISFKSAKTTLIAGANGSGKTSLLKVITGELSLISGEMRWFVSPDKIIYSSQAA